AAQPVAVAGADPGGLGPLGGEPLVQGGPVGAGRFHGHRVPPVPTQEGHDGFPAGRVGGGPPGQAGVGCGGEAGAGPVAARADADAGGVRTQHGPGLDLGGLPLAEGLAVELGPGLRRWWAWRWAWA